jgi:hypothetical protein
MQLKKNGCYGLLNIRQLAASNLEATPLLKFASLGYVTFYTIIICL